MLMFSGLKYNHCLQMFPSEQQDTLAHDWPSAHLYRLYGLEHLV